VYLAHHRDLERACALKILLPELAEKDSDYVARFRNEGRAAAALVHPNVITIHAVGQDRGLNFSRDGIRARPVAAAHDHRRTATGPAAGDGPGRPHSPTGSPKRIARGIVHRDLKPDNVLMTLQGVPKLADFGLAKRVIREGEVNLPDGLCGTPQFMAPELFQGVEAGPASDVYALGISYFLMLAGRCRTRAIR